LYWKNGQVPDRLLDAVFIVVGFYFGGAVGKKPIVEKNDEGEPSDPSSTH